MAVLAMVFACSSGVLAEESLKSAVQRGLLAEETQHDPKAATEAFSEAIRVGDGERALHATAIARLAEIRRRAGKTDEAAVLYRRLAREYPEQTALVELAARNAPSSGDATSDAGSDIRRSAEMFELADRISRERKAVEEAGSEATEFRATYESWAKRNREDLGRLLSVNSPTPELTALKAKRNQAREAIALLNPEFGPLHPEMVRAKERIKLIDEQWREELDAILDAKRSRMEEALERVDRKEAHLKAIEVSFAKLRDEEGRRLQESKKARVPAAGLPAAVMGAKVQIFGELHGDVPITEGTKLWLSDVILSYPNNDFANLSKIKVMRLGTEGNPESHIVDINKVIKGNDRSADFELKEGDRIQVPRKLILGL